MKSTGLALARRTGAALAFGGLTCVLACGSSGGGAAATADVAVAAEKGFLGYDVTDAGVTLHFDSGSVRGTFTVTQPGGVATAAIGTADIRIPGDLSPSVFSRLTPGTATWTVERWDRTTVSGSFEIGERFTTFFDATRAPGLTVDGLPATATVGDTIVVTGKTGAVGIVGQVYVGLPSGRVSSVRIGEGAQIPANSPFSFEVSAPGEGLMVVELTLTSGLPAAVLPVYVGGRVPLASSPLDSGFTTAKTVDVAAIADDVLTRVNALRASIGLEALAPHPLLAQTSATKAEDMSKGHYFGHISPTTGEDVTDLAAAVGLKGSVSENLAVEYTAERAYLGWYWSPVHRAALVEETNRTHGVGAAFFDESLGQIVFVQHLATSPAP